MAVAVAPPCAARAPLVTVFGTCRQHPIERRFRCTTIQSELTFTTSTKEAIQAIRFCKGELEIPTELTRYAFRSGILRAAAVDATPLRAQLEATDVVVVEVPSRWTYRFRDYYTHHILLEPAFEKDAAVRAGVVAREQSLEEVEGDLLVIRDSVAGKPLLVCSHFATYERGKRYQLVRWLETVCRKHGIAYLDPAVLLARHPVDRLFVKEDVLAHYSAEGEEAVAELYLAELGKVLETRAG